MNNLYTYNYDATTNAEKYHLDIHISKYTRKNRCYGKENPKINYVHSTIPHYNLYENLRVLSLVQILEQDEFEA